MIEKTIFIGKYFKDLESIDSTNSFSADLIKKNEAKHGMVVITNKQISGKGQREKIWSSEHFMNLTFSLILKTDFLLVSQQFLLSMAISNAILEYTNKKLVDSNFKALIKWPNDILVNNQKIAGILIENTILTSNLIWSIVGIGFNLNQDEFVSSSPKDFKPVSLKNLLSKKYDIINELELLCLFIEKWVMKLSSSKFEIIIETYKNNLWNSGKEIQFKDDLNVLKYGKIIGINEYGQLMIECDRNKIKSSAEITIQKYF